MWIEVFYEQGRNFGKNRAENKNKDIYVSQNQLAELVGVSRNTISSIGVNSMYCIE